MLNKCCISLNAKCNLACKYCHFYENNALDMHAIKELDSKKLITILTNILSYTKNENLPYFTIGFAGGGEPLLSWQILQNALSFIHKQDAEHKLLFYVISNGLLINEKFLEQYKRFYPHLKLIISLDGDEITHNTLRKDKNAKGTHKRIMKNIALYKAHFSANPAINISVSALSLARKEQILQFLLEQDFRDITFTRLFHCQDKTLEITQKQFLDFIATFDVSRFSIRNINAKKERKCDCIMYGETCGVGYNNIFYCDDRIYPCMRFVESGADIGHYADSLLHIKQTMQRLQKPLKELDRVCYYEAY